FSTELAKGKKILSSKDRGKGFKARNVNDGDPETYWSTPDDIKSADMTIELGAETEVNRILIQEYIKLGQRVQEFKVEAFIDGEWKHLIDGTTIGHKVIRKFPVVKTSRIKLTIVKSKACPLISNVEFYRAPGE
ncbi:MAG TPA: alpha-L-fucosidase, partial [Bacteroidales bacterium]|nr:alpha-L-fucosidase [Bacteroidales bacterium]